MPPLLKRSSQHPAQYGVFYLTYLWKFQSSKRWSWPLLLLCFDVWFLFSGTARQETWRRGVRCRYRRVWRGRWWETQNSSSSKKEAFNVKPIIPLYKTSKTHIFEKILNLFFFHFKLLSIFLHLYWINFYLDVFPGRGCWRGFGRWRWWWRDAAASSPASTRPRWGRRGARA